MTQTLDRPLVVINGLGAPSLAAHLYGTYFRTQGRRVFIAPQRCLYYGDIRASAELVAAHVHVALSRTGAARADLVGMSLGGLIGYYYIACRGGADTIARFVSVGGPINGCPIAKLGLLPPLSLAKAVAQCRPDSEILREIRAAPEPASVRLFTVGTRGDLITTSDCWQAPGFEAHETSHGVFPVGHWMLFAHPGNLRLVRDLLAG